MFDYSKINLKEWLRAYPLFLPESDYRASFIKAGKYINADNQELFFIEVAISVGGLAKPRLLRKIYAVNDPALITQLGPLVPLTWEFKEDPDSIMDALLITPPKEVDVEIRHYWGEDFFFAYSLITSVHPAGDLYTDYSDE